MTNPKFNPSRQRGNLGQAVDARQRPRKTNDQLTGANLGFGGTGGGSASAGGGGGDGSGDYTPPLAHRVDQAGHSGGSPTYGAVAGAINGANSLFTVSAAQYTTGTLLVWLNGVLQLQGTGSNEWAETTPGSGTFAFVTAPATGDSIVAMYRSE
jgi:hypothetical protein